MRLLLILGFLGFFSSSQAQEYTVIQIIGKIYNTETNTYLKSGSKINEETTLKFETPTARAAVLSTVKGRYIVQKTTKNSYSNDLIYALSAVISPIKGKLSTRSGSINNQMDFIKKFGEQRTVWIGDSYKTVVSAIAYPMDDTHFFYVSYEYNNETINKRLYSSGDTLVFDYSTFYAVDEVPIDPSTTTDLYLYYYNTTSTESIKLTSLNFKILSEDELEEIIESVSGFTKIERNKVLLEVITSLYGSCSEDEINAVLGNE